ncbi:CoA-binding protein [Brevibacillus nitrificans]|uniref:CoA-binding protein n=1 Tax=Brevibacillus nitrificans TaxID=651560 RepID=A0A3M8DMK9_9BACL|nr:acetate--CoA ligase family protein [Brevibacillus nitrificans]RNB88809.1 CoA-binding protein [Brevibacillus nitrificans]
MIHHPYKPLLSPESVAVVGASNTPGSIGHTAIKNFADIDFRGKVYGVNPRYEEVVGFPCYPSLLAIDSPIDVVIVAVASHLVEGTIRECIEKKVKFLVIFSSGFAETGESGRSKQNEIMELCKANDIRVVGPNALGIYNNQNKVLHSFIPVSSLAPTPIGEIAVISQSGATGMTFVSTAGDEEIGFSYMFTTGNQMDLNTNDFLEIAIEDASTKVISLYMEAVPNGEKLKQSAKKALAARKPIVALKAGRSDAGMKAALSHTASMTGSNQSFKTVVEQLGVTVVEEIEEMINALKVFRSGKRPAGKRVATLVISGAAGIMLADTVTELGLEMAVLEESTKHRLAEIVPSYCSLTNPVDIASTYTGDQRLYKHCIETLAAAEEVDIVIVHLPQIGPLGEKMANEIVEVAGSTTKPIIVAITGPEQHFGTVKRILNRGYVPQYSSLKSAGIAAKQLVSYEERYHRSLRQKELEIEQTAAALELVPIEINDVSVLTEPEVKQILQSFGVPVPKHVTVTKRDELLEKVKELKYPVAAKIVSRQITHKSDAGGVVLSINDERALASAYDSILAQVRENCPEALIEGVLVEEQVEGPFLEAFVGIKRDPVMGPIMICGLGGIYVEVLKDIAQRPAPISEEDALEMIQELKCYPIFTGIRKGLRYDVSAFAKALSQLSQIAVSMGDKWTGLEINPLIIRPSGEGVVALDGLLIVEE